MQIEMLETLKIIVYSIIFIGSGAIGFLFYLIRANREESFLLESRINNRITAIEERMNDLATKDDIKELKNTIILLLDFKKKK